MLGIEELISRLGPGSLTGILIVASLAATGAIIATTAVVAVQRRKTYVSQQAASLIQEMLSHNMPADEIEQLMEIWSRSNMSAEELIEYNKAVSRRKKKMADSAAASPGC